MPQTNIIRNKGAIHIGMRPKWPATIWLMPTHTDVRIFQTVCHARHKNIQMTYGWERTWNWKIDRYMVTITRHSKSQTYIYLCMRYVPRPTNIIIANYKTWHTTSHNIFTEISGYHPDILSDYTDIARRSLSKNLMKGFLTSLCSATVFKELTRRWGLIVLTPLMSNTERWRNSYRAIW